jgi:hypothetical protein
MIIRPGAKDETVIVGLKEYEYDTLCSMIQRILMNYYEQGKTWRPDFRTLQALLVKFCDADFKIVPNKNAAFLRLSWEELSLLNSLPIPCANKGFGDSMFKNSFKRYAARKEKERKILNGEFEGPEKTEQKAG